MRRWISFACLILFTAIATRPLWSSAQFFYSDDALLHLFRVFAFDQTLRQGVVYPRWVSDLAFGMGYPIFNYYPPLSAYLAETIHLFGATFADAIKIAFIGIVALAGYGAYVLAQEFFSDEKNNWLIGIVAASAYIFFPYTLTNIYVRGALAESLAAALLPWLFWSLRRTLTRQTISSIALTALFLALVLLAHSLTLLMSMPVIAAYVLLELARLPAAQRLRAFGFGFLSALLGAGLGAIYWLPFITELPLVKMGVTDEIRNLFRQPNYFFSASTLVQTSWIYQYNGQTLGLVASIIGILGIIAIFFFKSKARITLVFFGIVAILGTIAMLDVTQPLWLAIPFATMVQYPWRVSVLIGLSFTLIIGALPLVLSVWIKRFATIVQFVVAITIVGVMIWTTTANLSPQQISVPDEQTLGQLARFEEITGFVGTTTFGEYLPNTVKTTDLTDHSQPSISTTASAENIILYKYSANLLDFWIYDQQPISLTWRILYTPDWHAFIDKREVQVSNNNGLITVNIPSSTHNVRLVRNQTSAQQIGTWLSILSIIVLTCLLFVSRKQNIPTEASVIVFVCTLFVVGIPNVIGFLSPVSILQSGKVDIAPGLQTIGIRLDETRETFKCDSVVCIPELRGDLHLRVYWYVKQPLQDKPFTWQLVNEQEQIVSQRTQLANYGVGTMTSWIPSEIIEDSCTLPADGIQKPGKYTLRVAYGNTPSVVVDAIYILQVSKPPQAETTIAHPLNAQFDNNLRLIGYDAPQILQPNARLPLTLYWQADHDMLNDAIAVIRLFDVNDKPVVQPFYAGRQFIGLNPSSLWTPNKIVTDRQDLFVPRKLDPGLYRIAVSLWRYPDGEVLPITSEETLSIEDAALFGEIKVPMNMTNVNPQQSLNVAVGSQIRLIGFDAAIQDKSGKPIPQNDATRLQAQANQFLFLKLYWQTSADIRTDYKIFVHLVDANGKVVAQQDQAPDEWKYPTRIWDAGEIVTDPHSMALKNLEPGTYRVRVGMYDAASGERLPMVDAGHELPDRQIELGAFEIRP
jgi:hypothetical protein